MLAAVGCGGETDEPRVAKATKALAVDGPWHIPPETLAIGDTQYVDYTSAGPWVGSSGCGGDILSGTALLRDFLYTYFPQTYHIGGYACRPINGNPSQMSVHATGRALDIMLHLDGGEADNGVGDPIGNWLIENAEAIGISLIIWDLYSWGAHRTPGEKDRDYGGAHPHHDHLHVELSVEMADQQELWFLDAVDMPKIPGCEPLSPNGGIIEETDACFRAFGPSEFWRVEDAGSDGSLLWTNAFENDTPSNWARWNAYLEESGRYAIEVYVDPAWGVNRDTRYRVDHGAGEEIIYVDQSVEQGWVSLGEYELSSDDATWIDVYDDVAMPVEDDQHIAVDAVRLTRLDLEGEPDPEPDPQDPQAEPDPEEEPDIAISGEAEAGCACTTAPRPGGGWAWAMALMGLVTLRRRRR